MLQIDEEKEENDDEMEPNYENITNDINQFYKDEKMIIPFNKLMILLVVFASMTACSILRGAPSAISVIGIT